METVLEVVRVILTLSFSFLFALLVGRLCLSGLLRGLLAAPSAMKTNCAVKELRKPSGHKLAE